MDTHRVVMEGMFASCCGAFIEVPPSTGTGGKMMTADRIDATTDSASAIALEKSQTRLLWQFLDVNPIMAPQDIQAAQEPTLTGQTARLWMGQLRTTFAAK